MADDDTQVTAADRVLAFKVNLVRSHCDTREEQEEVIALALARQRKEFALSLDASARAWQELRTQETDRLNADRRAFAERAELVLTHALGAIRHSAASDIAERGFRAEARRNLDALLAEVRGWK